MSTAVVILLVVIGGVLTWGALTDWTFSGILPRAGAKCKPETPATNAKKYVYSNADPPTCTVIATCNTDWVPAKSNTVCEYSKSASTCTPEGTPDPEGVYTFDTNKKCNLTGCNNNFKFISASAGCKSCKDGYTKDGTVCRKCKDTDVPVLPSLATFKDLPGLTYKTENGNCIPNRMVFGGNNGTANCHTYCAGTNGGPWNTVTPPEWKGAKCVGVTNGSDHKTFNTTVKCETVRGTDVGNENACVCERNDATPWVNKGWGVVGGERLFGKDNITKSWLEGVDVSDGVTYGINYIKTSDDKWPKDANECIAIAKTKGYKAVGMRAAPRNCWGLTSAGLAAGTGLNATSAGHHYMVCVDDKTKKVWPNKCA